MSAQAVTMPKAVRVIPAKPEYSGKSNSDFRPKRVAAYCRVSTDKEEQEHSFETQKEMYTDMIMMKPNWQMAGIYADEGITGTIAKKRPDFMRMIEDCRKGKIDMVITVLKKQSRLSAVCTRAERTRNSHSVRKRRHQHAAGIQRTSDNALQRSVTG